MSGLGVIRDAIKTTVESNVSGLTVYDTVPDVVNLPALVVRPNTASFDMAMGRGTDTWTFEVYVLVSVADMDIGQDALDDYVTGAGAKSIRQVIFTNKTLGLSDVNAHISEMSNYGVAFESAQAEHIGAILHLTIHTKGTA